MHDESALPPADQLLAWLNEAEALGWPTFEAWLAMQPKDGEPPKPE